MSITAMKQAVQALIDIEIATDLKRLYRYDDEKRMAEVVEDAITALRTAIQEAEACEPSAWLCCVPGQDACLLFHKPSDEQYPPKFREPLYAAPQPAPKQEPFCYLYYERGEEMFAPPDGYHPDDAQPLYLAPPQAQAAKPLTVEHIERIYHRYGGDMVNCTRAIEREHGIKEQP